MFAASQCSLPCDAIDPEASFLLLDARAQGSSAGRLNKAWLVRFHGVFFPLGRNKNPSVGQAELVSQQSSADDRGL